MCRALCKEKGRTKKISNYIILSLASLSLAFGLSPVYAFAGNNVPSCHHGDIVTNITTMVPIFGLELYDEILGEVQ